MNNNQKKSHKKILSMSQRRSSRGSVNSEKSELSVENTKVIMDPITEHNTVIEENTENGSNTENNQNLEKNDNEYNGENNGSMEPLVISEEENETEQNASPDTIDSNTDTNEKSTAADNGSPVLMRSSIRRNDIRNSPSKTFNHHESEITTTTKDEQDNDFKLTQTTKVVLEKIESMEETKVENMDGSSKIETIEESKQIYEEEIVVTVSDNNIEENLNLKTHSEILKDSSPLVEEFNKEMINDEQSENNVEHQYKENGQSNENDKQSKDESEEENLSFSDTSVMANYSGNNTTQNIDFSLSDSLAISSPAPGTSKTTSDDHSESDLSRESSEAPRDLSYIRSLKVGSGRKTLHDLRQTTLRNTLKYNPGKSPLIGKVTGQQRSSTLKRKGHGVTNDWNYETKRIKTESDDNRVGNSLLSYMSSPINLIKSKLMDRGFNREQRYQTNGDEEEYYNYTSVVEMPVEEKTNKWCIIQ